MVRETLATEFHDIILLCRKRAGNRAVEFSTDTDEFEGEVEVESGAVAGVFVVVDA
jgi:hypothetical protein